jgi:hypothetical protein
MFYLTHILQLVIDRFNYRAFAQVYLVRHGHQAVLHVIADTGNQMDAISKEYLGQFLGNIALVTEKLSEYALEKTLVLQGFAVVNIGLCDGEIQYFPSVIYDQMQLEPIKITHGRFSYSCNVFKDLVAFNPFVLADPDTGGIYERYSCTIAHTARFQEHGQRQ